MKTILTLPSILILLVFFSACQKSESATPTTKPAIDTTNKTDTALQNPPFPYMDQYVGLLYATAQVLPEGGTYDSDASFMFYVNYLNQDSLLLSNPASIVIGQGGLGVPTITLPPNFIYWVVTLNAISIYGVNFRLVNDSLYVETKNVFIEYNGDGGDASIQFAGKKVHRK